MSHFKHMFRKNMPNPVLSFQKQFSKTIFNDNQSRRHD